MHFDATAVADFLIQFVAIGEIAHYDKLMCCLLQPQKSKQSMTLNPICYVEVYIKCVCTIWNHSHKKWRGYAQFLK